MNCIPSIAVIGAGNVATHLAKRFDAFANVVQICSRNIEHSRQLASQLKNAQAIDNLSAIDSAVDYCIISVSDDSVREVAKGMPHMKGVVAHTSGSVPIEAIEGVSERYGVLYPLQTFTKGVSLQMQDVPFFTEANCHEAYSQLDTLALLTGASVAHADSAQRGYLHLAAVFACNFANNMWSIASDILAAHGYDFSVLYPILKVTLEKAVANSPRLSQTGPAARHDYSILQKQMEMLPADVRQIYNILSESILNNTAYEPNRL